MRMLLAALWVPAMLLAAASAGAAPANDAEAEEEALAQQEAGQGAGAENLVIRNETIGCDDACVDTFEVKCTQTSRTLHIQITDTAAADDPLIVSYVGTAPLTMLGVGDIDDIAAGGSRGFTFTRPGLQGLMKALVSVTGNGIVAPGTYELRAECKNQDGVSKQTVVTRKQNQ